MQSMMKQAQKSQKQMEKGQAERGDRICWQIRSRSRGRNSAGDDKKVVKIDFPRSYCRPRRLGI